MPSGNIGEATPSIPPAEPATRPFRFPAEYYCAPLAEVRPIFPRGLVIGCGSASAALLILMFAAGAIFSGPRFGELLDLFVGTSVSELHGMYAPDVSPAEKQRFDAEIERMRAGLRTGKVPVKNLQPFIKEMQNAITDKQVTAEELDRLTQTAHEAQVTK